MILCDTCNTIIDLTSEGSSYWYVKTERGWIRKCNGCHKGETMPIPKITTKMGIASIRLEMKRLLRKYGGRATYEFAKAASDYKQHGTCCLICGDDLFRPISQGPPCKNPHQQYCDECHRIIGEAVLMPDYLLSHMPATPMTMAEMQQQCRLVSEVAKPENYVCEDEEEGIIRNNKCHLQNRK